MILIRNYLICILICIQIALPNTIFNKLLKKNIEVNGEGASIASALLNAKRNALTKLLGEHIISFSKVKNNTLIEDIIVSTSKGYIANYKILNYDTLGNIKKVLIKADIVTLLSPYLTQKSNIIKPKIYISIKTNTEKDVVKNLLQSIITKEILNYKVFQITTKPSKNYRIDFNIDIGENNLSNLYDLDESSLLSYSILISCKVTNKQFDKIIYSNSKKENISGFDYKAIIDKYLHKQLPLLCKQIITSIFLDEI